MHYSISQPLKQRNMATWTIDPSHSEITFKVRHLMISTVKGNFGTFDATLEGDESNDFADAKVTFSADISSISTGNEQRDGHLKSPDFFAAEEYPKLSFVSTGLEKTGDKKYKLHGDLSIRATTKPVVLDVEYTGSMVDFYGNTKAGFDIKGSINRLEYGLSWNAVTEAGGIVVSEDVKLELDVQMSKN